MVVYISSNKKTKWSLSVCSTRSCSLWWHIVAAKDCRNQSFWWIPSAVETKEDVVVLHHLKSLWTFCLIYITYLHLCLVTFADNSSFNWIFCLSLLHNLLTAQTNLLILKHTDAYQFSTKWQKYFKRNSLEKIHEFYRSNHPSYDACQLTRTNKIGKRNGLRKNIKHHCTASCTPSQWWLIV